MMDTKASDTTTSSSADEQTQEPIVHASHLHLAFGGEKVLDNISFSVSRGAAILLRGDNGSGKTTLLNVLSGYLRPQSGSIRMHLNHKTFDVTRTSPECLARNGLGRVWQDIRLFPTMTVMENVLAATPGLTGSNPLLALAAWSRVRQEEAAARESARMNLELVGLADRATSSADRLSVGQMKRVAIARLLQGQAKILLLDEPLAGLDDESIEALTGLLQDLKARQGKTLMIVEHRHEHMTSLCGETWYLADGHLDTGTAGETP